MKKRGTFANEVAFPEPSMAGIAAAARALREEPKPSSAELRIGGVRIPVLLGPPQIDLKYPERPHLEADLGPIGISPLGGELPFQLHPTPFGRAFLKEVHESTLRERVLQTARHEAAHALVAYVLGIGVERVEVTVGDDDVTGETVLERLVVSRVDPGARPGTDGYYTLLVLMAGVQAEGGRSTESVLPDRRSRDWAMAVSIATVEQMEAAAQEARRIVHDEWAAVEGLAQELAKEMRLGRAQIEHVIRGAMGNVDFWVGRGAP